MKKSLCFIILYLVILPVMSQQKIEPLKINLIFKLDSYGNSDMEASMKLNAAQWDNFKRKIGTNVSILKREMERSLPSYFLQDFRYEEQPMDRIYTLKFKALGVAKYKNKDKWVIELDDRNPDVTPVSEEVYMMNSNFLQNGVLSQQTSKIIFPKGTKEIKEETDSFGNALFTYKYHTLGTITSFLGLIIGIILTLISGVGFYLKLKPIQIKPSL